MRKVFEYLWLCTSSYIIITVFLSFQNINGELSANARDETLYCYFYDKQVHRYWDYTFLKVAKLLAYKVRDVSSVTKFKNINSIRRVSGHNSSYKGCRTLSIRILGLLWVPLPEIFMYPRSQFTGKGSSCLLTYKNNGYCERNHFWTSWNIQKTKKNDPGSKSEPEKWQAVMGDPTFWCPPQYYAA